MQELVAIGVFVIVYALIALRKRVGIPIWTSMLIGAALMMILQVISVEEALQSVNIDVIIFLFGMFSIVSALEMAGALRKLAVKMLSVTRSPSHVLLAFVVGMGVLAAFVVNDTIALLGVPLVAYVSARSGLRPDVLLISLAFGITVGSVMTPVGNPQNLLIALQSGIPTPFLVFLTHLGVPTLINLGITFGILKVVYRKDLRVSDFKLDKDEMAREADRLYDPVLARMSIVILVATIAGFLISELLLFLNVAHFNLSAVAIVGAAVLYAFSNKRVAILKSVNYSVLIFFASMFIVMSALWSSGAVSTILEAVLPDPDPGNPLQSAAVISAAATAGSQILSNVPFVTFYNYVMLDNGFTKDNVDQWMMLAAASTVAGNLTILGAASNVIIVEAAESRRVSAFSFFGFLKVGAPVTAANLAVYYLFITLF